MIEISEVLSSRNFVPFRKIYFSDNEKAGADRIVYPYKFYRDAENDRVDKNIFILDMVELRKFMSCKKNSKDTFYDRLVNNIDAYKDNMSCINMLRQELFIYWWAFCDQMKMTFDDMKARRGMIVIPNIDYFQAFLKGNETDYTNLRIEFSYALKECLIFNYNEAYRLNNERIADDKEILPSDEYVELMKRFIKQQ